MNITFYKHRTLAGSMGVSPAVNALDSHDWWLRAKGVRQRPEGFSRYDCLKYAKQCLAWAKKLNGKPARISNTNQRTTR